MNAIWVGSSPLHILSRTPPTIGLTGESRPTQTLSGLSLHRRVPSPPKTIARSASVVIGHHHEARTGGLDRCPHWHADVHGRLVVMTGATAVAGVALGAPQLDDTLHWHPIGPFPADQRASGDTAQGLTGRGEDLSLLGDGQIGGQRATVEWYRPAPDLDGGDMLGRTDRVDEGPDSHHHDHGDERSPSPRQARRSKGNHGRRTSGRGKPQYMTVR